MWPQRSALPKAERWEASGKTPEREPLGGLFQGLPRLSRQPGKPIIHPTKECYPRRDPMIWHQFSGRWPLLLVFLTLMSMKSRMSGLVRRTSGPPIRWQKLPKRHQLLLVSAPNWVDQNHGPKRDSFPKALKWQAGLSFSPRCRKVWQNEGMVVNHLCTMHYCLGLICALCWDFFTTSVDTIRWLASSCESLTMKD